MSARTVEDLLEERLRQLGVQRIYGQPLGALDHVPVEDVELAVLLADADGRIGHDDGSGRLGAARVEDVVVHLSSKPGGRAPLVTVQSPEELIEALADPPGLIVPGVAAIHLDLDLGAPVPDGLAARSRVQPEPVVTLDPSMASLDVVAVVGPGVVRCFAVDDLAEMARKGGIGVLNTWGAKGVQRWDSPFHFGTAGLQERDFALAGLADADVVITSGLDPDESPVDALGNWVVQDVHPRQLAALCHRWPLSRTVPVRPRFYDAIAEVVVPLYESDSVPLTGPRAALHMAGALPDRGVVVADPGPAGFWIARTLPTSHPGSVCVPATGGPGFAAAAALVCRMERRPCLAVTDQVSGSGVDDVSAAVMELAESLGLGVGLQLWGPDGSLSDSAAHVALLSDHLDTAVVRLDDVPVLTDDTDGLLAVAGAPVGWAGGVADVSGPGPSTPN